MTTLCLRYMNTHDIGEVVEIDRQSFDMPWSARSYLFEITESTYSHMLALEQRAEASRGPLDRLLRRKAYTVTHHTIGAYGGLWLIAGEAHISTIASAPLQRGHGLGELALAAMIRRSITLHATHVVLEVRVSNLIAQRLYKKYGFETVGIKQHYYSNNHEDAFDMRLELEHNAEGIARFAERWAELRQRQRFEDSYTEGAPPR